MSDPDTVDSLPVSKETTGTGHHVSSSKVSMWEAVRDIFVTAIHRGQLIWLLIGVAILIILWRFPDKGLVEIARLIVIYIKDGWLVGYILASLACLGWWIHAKRLLRVINEDLKSAALNEHGKASD